MAARPLHLFGEQRNACYPPSRQADADRIDRISISRDRLSWGVFTLKEAAQQLKVAGQQDKAQKHLIPLVVAGENPPKPLQPAEKPLHLIAPPVQLLIGFCNICWVCYTPGITG